MPPPPLQGRWDDGVWHQRESLAHGSHTCFFLLSTSSSQRARGPPASEQAGPTAPARDAGFGLGLGLGGLQRQSGVISRLGVF